MTAPGKAVIPDGWERLAKKLGNGLRDVLAASGYAAVVAPDVPRAVPLAEWFGEIPETCAVARFDVSAFKGTLFFSVPPIMIGGMVDRFYGGHGTDNRSRTHLTAGECRFFDRLARQVGDALTQACASILPVIPVLIASETDGRELSGGRADEEVVVQAFTIDQDRLEFVFPLSAMRALTVTQTATPITVPASSPAWGADLASAAMDIRFPVRTIIASPTISIARLLELAPGDVLQIVLPPLVPLTVAGRLVARGTIGEANGRAAIQIQEIQGGVQHDS